MVYESLSASELVRECIDTDNAEAWQEFVRRYTRAIANVVYRVARSAGEARKEVIDDLVQDVFLKLCADGSPGARRT